MLQTYVYIIAPLRRSPILIAADSVNVVKEDVSAAGSKNRGLRLTGNFSIAGATL